MKRLSPRFRLHRVCAGRGGGRCGILRACASADKLRHAYTDGDVRDCHDSRLLGGVLAFSGKPGCRYLQRWYPVSALGRLASVEHVPIEYD